MAAPMRSTRPFWAGLDPDKPEPLDKVLAALHCSQVAPPSAYDAFHFEFTVNRDDHHRIQNGFPELQKLTAADGEGFLGFRGTSWVIPFEFDPSTGKLATMAAPIYSSSVCNISHESYHLMRNGLESLGQLDKPAGLIALDVQIGLVDVPASISTIELGNAGKDKTPNRLVVFFHGNHAGASKYAQLLADNDAQTVVAVQLALPGWMDSKRKSQRLARNSCISVFTMMDGVIKTVVQQEPLSTPGGEIKLWLSDLVKERESLSDEFVRPLHIGASCHQPNITVLYATIIASAHKAYDNFSGHGNASINTTRATAPSSIMLGSSKRLLSTLASGPISNGDKQSLSTLAGRLVANGVFSPGDKRQSLSTLVGGHVVKRPMPYGYQRTLGTAISRGPHLVVSPVKAAITPWSRLLVRCLRGVRR
ncbi:hypothetical protein B0H67DRAFT_555669 [Lasiosphaeris hirsuta]|uniref:Uncharacterized protein n=1 Tax=Lasiosphaeris hirsuta TaxID=260670 RepID=A0AA40A9F3_9PEZI|nr:hypothetical protein B0H67DRAFT_555669 [Lasiosphaeris hirsuta]